MFQHCCVFNRERLIVLDSGDSCFIIRDDDDGVTGLFSLPRARQGKLRNDQITDL